MKYILLAWLLVCWTGVACAQTTPQLLTFSFLKANNPTLSDDVSLTAVGGYSLLTLPTGTNLSALKATFTATAGSTVSVSGVAQTSNVTAVDFSKPVVYQLVAANSAPASYTVEVSVQVDLAVVEGAVKAFMGKYNVPGMSVAITKDERLVYAKGYGLANTATNEPVTNNSLFRIASVSKSITAMALMKLVDEGKLNLDQKVFGAGGILGTAYGSKPYTPQTEQITVRHVLSHTAGADAWNHLWDPVNNRIDPFYQKEWLGYTQAQVIGAVLDNRPVTETPGTKMIYSNVGINIAGRILEKVSGVGYEKYVQDNLLKPLGISPASMRIGGTTLADRAPNEVVYYNPYPGYDQPYDFPVPRLDAHGGWTTTAVNLVRLLTAVDGSAGRKDVLSKARQQEMTTAVRYGPTGNQTTGWYGLGWFAQNGAFWHSGGMAGTASYWLKIGNYTFAILINTRDASAQYYTDIDKLCYQMSDNLTLNTFMKGDQFDLFYKAAEAGQKEVCTPLHRDVWSCASTTGTIGIQSVKIWSAGKTATLLDSKDVCSKNGNAYSDLTDQPAISLPKGSAIPFQVEAMRIQEGANKGGIYPVRVSIWLDLNQDRTFTENERLFVSNPAVASPNPFLENQFTIPATALSGPTRMRIRAGTAFSATPESPCEQLDGETEDYLVNISSTCQIATTLTVGSSTLCQGNSTTLAAMVTGGQGAITYAWQRDNAPLTETSASLSVSAGGVYRLTATDASSCTNGSSVTVVVNPQPVATIVGKTFFCAGKATSLSATITSGTGSYSLQWKRDSSALTTDNALYVSRVGIYSLTAKDSRGCTGSSSVSVVEAQNPVPVVAGSASFCEGQTISLAASSTAGVGTFSSTWQRDQVAIGAGSPFLTTLAGTYVATLTDVNGCVGTSAGFAVTQKTTPVAQIVGVSVLAGGLASLSATPAEGVLSYQWSLNGTALSGATSATYTVRQSGTYRVTVNGDGCTSVSPGLMVGVLATGGRQGTESASITALLTVAPNPSAGQITIRLQLTEPAPATLSLTDLLGRQLRQWPLPTRQTHHEQAADLRGLPTGTYLIVAEATGQRVVSKLLIE